MSECVFMRKDKDVMSTVKDLALHVCSERGDSGLVCSILKQKGRTAVLCFEQYYYRVKGYVAATVVIAEEDDEIDAMIVVSGGGEGIFGFSMGAESHYAYYFVKVLEKIGFEKRNINI